MLALPENHPDRYVLADEVHARPYEPLQTPSSVTHLSVLVDSERRIEERDHLNQLCEQFNVAGITANLTYFIATLGPCRIKWERHGEFSSYTFFVAASPTADFDDSAAASLPNAWLSKIPGTIVFAAKALLLAQRDWPVDSARLSAFLAAQFRGNTLIGSQVADGAAIAYTDFKIHGDGLSRFVVLDGSMTPAQAGRTMQRLFEIESYRMMCLLALPIARRQAPRMSQIERSLASLTDDIARDGGDDEALLHELTRLAAEVESGLAASQFRFGACRAYADLVNTRISQLAEQRLAGMQTINEFMSVRLTPAVATCLSVSQRLHGLSERVAQASGLLSTRVNITRERQNQSLLASMDRRARQQLRLQQTVEGLSAAAIAYYVCGLISLAAKAIQSAGVPINPDLVVGLSIPVVIACVLFAIRRVRRHIGGAASNDASAQRLAG